MVTKKLKKVMLILINMEAYTSYENMCENG